jgi:hypothetical protein
MTDSKDAHERSEIPPDFLGQLSPGLPKDEQLWNLAATNVPKGFLQRWPSEVFLLLGLVITIVVIAYTLTQLDGSDASFVSAIGRDIPKALFISALFMLLGWGHRLVIQRYENQVEDEYQRLLASYVEFNAEPGVVPSSSSNTQIAEQLALLRTDLTDSLQEQVTQLGEALRGFKSEAASVSSAEIEETLNRFAREIQEIPERLGRVIDSKMEEPQKDRADFRKAVSGFLSWPVDLEGLNGAIKNNTDQLSQATQTANSNFEQIALFIKHFDESTVVLTTTTETSRKTIDRLDQFTVDLSSHLNSFGEMQRQMAENIPTMTSKMTSELEAAIGRANEQTVAAYGGLTSSTDSLKTFAIDLTEKAKLHYESSQRLSQGLREALDRIATDQEERSTVLTETLHQRLDQQTTSQDKQAQLLVEALDNAAIRHAQSLDQQVQILTNAITTQFEDQTQRSSSAILELNDRIESVPQIMASVVDRVNDGVHLAMREALNDEFKQGLSIAIAEAVSGALKDRKSRGGWFRWK